MNIIYTFNCNYLFVVFFSVTRKVKASEANSQIKKLIRKLFNQEQTDLLKSFIYIQITRNFNKKPIFNKLNVDLYLENHYFANKFLVQTKFIT